jgi:uncharacterized membrane protein YbhN (UPF0104 family)
VFDRILSTFKAEYRSLVTTLICAVVAGMSGVVGILFVGIAIFIWASSTYGTLQACLAMAGFFLIVALIAVAILFYARSEAAKRAVKQAEEERREREEAAKRASARRAELGDRRLGTAARAQCRGRRRDAGRRTAGGVA